MPGRIIKESILSSDNFNAMSFEGQIFVTRLFVKVDDFGRYEARISVLRPSLFGHMLDRVSEAMVEQMLREAEKNEMIQVYFVEGKPFLQFRTWKKHNRIRAKTSKYPDPPAMKHTGPDRRKASRETPPPPPEAKHEADTPPIPPIPTDFPTDEKNVVNRNALAVAMGVTQVSPKDVITWNLLAEKGATLVDLKAAHKNLLDRKKPLSIKTLSNGLLQTVILEQMEKRLALERRGEKSGGEGKFDPLEAVGLSDGK